MTHSEPNFILTPDDAPRSVESLRRQALRLLQQAGDEEEPSGRATYAAPHDNPAPHAGPAPARAVMVGLVTMPAVFIVIVMGALALFGKPVATNAAPTDRASQVARLEQPAGTPALGASLASARSKKAAAAGITLGEDMRIADISLDGDRVALHVESPMGQEIVIFDYARGEVVAAAPIETASSETVDSLAMLTGAPQPAVKAATLPPPVAVDVAAAPAPAPVEIASVAAAPRAPTMKPRGSN